jgi:DNA polymerase III delta prime subunit
MIKEPLIQKQTKSDIDDFINNPVNSVLLVGQVGSGKSTLAHYIAVELLGEIKLQAEANYLLIEPEDNLISIESIRRISKFIRLKSTGKSRYNRVIIIDNADKMNEASQNTLLKTLEEPPDDTLIILCASSHKSLLPTIVSRLRVIEVRNLDQQELTSYFKKLGYQDKDINLAVLVSNGRIGMINSILSNESDVNLTSLESAKKFISMKKSDRLIAINSLSKNRADILALCDSFINIARASLNASAEKDNKSSIAIWNRVLTESLQAREALSKNASIKLVMTKLFLAI